MQGRKSHNTGLPGRVFLAMVLILGTVLPVYGESFDQGWQAYQAGDYNEAVRIWKPLARRGDTDAQVNLGLMYDIGRGVSQDAERAVQWYQLSANNGHAAAQYNLGVMFSNGRGVPPDQQQALHWLQRAADQGVNEAHSLIKAHSTEQLQQASVQTTPDRNEFIDGLSGVSTGTAWPISGQYAVTSNHVVAEAGTVTLYDVTGQAYLAKVLLHDDVNDLALLGVVDRAEKLPPALPISNKPTRLGSTVFTIGFPRVDIMGRTPKLTDGIISSVHGYRDDPDSYQISVPIQPGNSGGPLLNMDGEVVGVVASMLGTVTASAESRALPNVSYAVKVRQVLRLLAALPEQVTRRTMAASDGASLADLAETVQASVLIVVATE